jgi:ribosomal protein S4
MDHRYLAAQDGSEQAQGRGSGLEQIRPRNLKEPIPYMQMAYAPLERRLDTVIFRALFASSTRQARQFVIHGAVRVNGKKVQHVKHYV